MSKLNRKSKHFRMSVESIAFLEALAEKIGVTDTEIVERGISELAAQEFTDEERKEMITKKIKEVLDL
ncbi:hypothetical protein M5J14_23830 [Lysinibacillus sp. OL1_EC]|uniref:hypothetical protein n=1 Tax=Lysinibacillus sp. OL1_EC TaxID=2943493 RepID=UPI0020303AEE|nr:hypothetical protein [Lysinibacillus sp. OL1_EC]MCM0627504.1 hypothetical protein [Lysinibacillus sp. OL1_EC]